MRISDWSSDVCSSDLLMTADTRIAMSAGAIGQYDVVTDLQISDFGPQRFDHTGPLVAENHRQRHRIVLITRDQVRVAHAGRHHLHQYFVASWLADGCAFDRKGRSEEHTSELQS